MQSGNRIEEMMKYKKGTIFLLVALLLSGCDRFPSSSSNQNSNSSNTSGSEQNNKQKLDFFAMNDFHGALLEDSSYSEPGLAKAATFLKEKKSSGPDSTLIISSGDMWQGTFESYHSKGNVVTEAMNEIGFDAMTIGNHEFDWGSQYIEENALLANFPLLGANIMEYPNTSKKSHIGEEYKIFEKSGVKIGVIGMIGQDQITSITSRLVEDITFASPTPLVKSLSQKLRREENVDLVVLSLHAGQESVDNSLTSEGHVDVVFNAHTHKNEIQVKHGVPFIQGGDKGKYISHIQLEFDLSTRKAQTIIHQNIDVASLNIVPDEEVSEIINNFKLSSDILGNTYIGKATGDFTSYSGLANISNYATAQEAVKQGYNIDFVISNKTRETLYSGDVYYRDLFKGLPFDNAIYIAKASGKDIKYEAKYSSTNFYRVKDYAVLGDNTFYTVAIIDYMLLHQNINKQYNYFSDYVPSLHYIDILEDAAGAPFYPRDLVKELFFAAPNNELSSYDSLFTNNRYSSLTA